MLPDLWQLQLDSGRVEVDFLLIWPDLLERWYPSVDLYQSSTTNLEFSKLYSFHRMLPHREL